VPCHYAPCRFLISLHTGEPVAQDKGQSQLQIQSDAPEAGRPIGFEGGR
jgi:hypothetical protein